MGDAVALSGVKYLYIRDCLVGLHKSDICLISTSLSVALIPPPVLVELALLAADSAHVDSVTVRVCSAYLRFASFGPSLLIFLSIFTVSSSYSGINGGVFVFTCLGFLFLFGVFKFEF